MDQRPNVKAKTPRRKYKYKSLWRLIGNSFLAMAPKAQVTKEKINWISSKLKTLCFKGYKKVKR